jgi:hypothetical protein
MVELEVACPAGVAAGDPIDIAVRDGAQQGSSFSGNLVE